MKKILIHTIITLMVTGASLVANIQSPWLTAVSMTGQANEEVYPFLYNINPARAYGIDELSLYAEFSTPYAGLVGIQSMRVNAGASGLSLFNRFYLAGSVKYLLLSETDGPSDSYILAEQSLATTIDKVEVGLKIREEYQTFSSEVLRDGTELDIESSISPLKLSADFGFYYPLSFEIGIAFLVGDIPLTEEIDTEEGLDMLLGTRMTLRTGVVNVEGGLQDNRTDIRMSYQVKDLVQGFQLGAGLNTLDLQTANVSAGAIYDGLGFINLEYGVNFPFAGGVQSGFGSHQVGASLKF